ncbi:aspartate-alanine antiporter [Neisseriaceae bacterium ESL0693]|nr:aspartate-alanine antiporter [Neisseriaceae bacterium ESL0693]
MLSWIQKELQHSPEILLFLSVACGYLLGKIKFGKFQLGGVAGSLIAAVVFSLLGVSVSSGIQALLFALFIYAVGFESGPQFFKSLGLKTLREILLALFVAVAGLITVVIMAKWFHIDKGLAAGLAAGGLTQSAIIGTASDALTHLGLPAQTIQTMQGNVAVGYAVTYIFGSLGTIIICVNILPYFMGKGIRDAAIEAEAEQLKGAIVLHPGQEKGLPDIVGRVYRLSQPAQQTVTELEQTLSGITIERLKRRNRLINVTPDTRLLPNDQILVVGPRQAIVAAAPKLGTELENEVGMDVVMDTKDVVLHNQKYTHHKLNQFKHIGSTLTLAHGVYVLAVHRDGDPVSLTEDTVLELKDVLTLYGSERDLDSVTRELGAVIPISTKTDWIYHGFGIALGLIIGLIVINIGSIPITLGAGGGALLSGLIFGWLRRRHQLIGNLPVSASTLMKDFGLAGFVAAVGLQTGLQAITTIEKSGISLFLIGVVVTVVPLLLAIPFGKYVLRYRNTAVFAGALAGSRSANPAFGGILDKAGNSVPTTPFAITYALANVFLTLLGPLVVAFV